MNPKVKKMTQTQPEIERAYEEADLEVAIIIRTVEAVVEAEEAELNQ